MTNAELHAYLLRVERRLGDLERGHTQEWLSIGRLAELLHVSERSIYN